MMPPMPQAGRKRIIRNSRALLKIVLMQLQRYKRVTPGRLQRSRAKRWTGVRNSCSTSGVVNCAILIPFSSETLMYLISSFPIGVGSVKADAIAMRSLKKNSPRETLGKGFTACPYLTAYFLSLMRLVEVLTRKTMISFWMFCGISGERLTYSDRLEVMQVREQTKYIQRKEKPEKKETGVLKMVSKLSLARPHSPPFPLVYSMMDRSTTTLKGETLKPERAPASASISRVFHLGVVLGSALITVQANLINVGHNQQKLALRLPFASTAISEGRCVKSSGPQANQGDGSLLERI